jgi:RNA polymerase sigma-70 factor (ECF subfamily)
VPFREDLPARVTGVLIVLHLIFNEGYLASDPETELVRLDPSPIVRLNRAIAVAEVDGPEVALAAVDRLPLQGCRAFHGTRAEPQRRLGRSEESRAAYDRAIGLAGNTAETAHLIRRRDQLAGATASG